MSQMRIAEGVEVLRLLDLPPAQLNERTALCLLALLNLKPEQAWQEAADPMIGITPMMDWIRENYGKSYAPNTRETIRRQSVHQMVAAGLVLYNPDQPDRSVNSPRAVYQIEPSALELLRSYQSRDWGQLFERYVGARQSLVARYARERAMNMIPVQISAGMTIDLSPGAHSDLIRLTIENFAPRFAPDSTLIYVGDTGQKWAYFDVEALAELNVRVDAHGKMPDVVFFDARRNWLILIEAVTSHGPVDGKRHDELSELFADSTAGLVYVTAFPSRALMTKYLSVIAWETEVWVADTPDHLIHFNGERFLGPYSQN